MRIREREFHETTYPAGPQVDFDTARTRPKMLSGCTALSACVLLLSVATTGTRGQMPSAKSADQDPIAFFAGMAALPTQQQDAFLAMAGQSLMDSNDSIDCNIFGGEKSCKTIPADSKFANSCTAYRPDLKVDCVYYSTSEDHLDMHPGDALNKFLQGANNNVSSQCPQCLSTLQALWCVQALPECGSFQTHVHKAIFPAIIEAKKEEDAGQPQQIAIAEAVPGLVRAMSKTMACKEMCEAAVTSCSCKKDGNDILTFGEAIENAEKVEDGFKQLGLQTLGEDFRDTLFRDIWNEPVCDIFTSKDHAEFAGQCDDDVIGDNAQCTSSGFCEGLDDAQRAGVETIIATQLARSVFAFVEGPAGVIQQKASATSVAKTPGALDQIANIKKPGTGVATPSVPTPPAPALPAPTQPQLTVTDVDVDTGTTASTTLVEVTPDAGEPEKKKSVVGTVFGVLLVLVVVAGVAAFGWKKYQEYKARQYGDYGPMGMDAYGDDGIPLQ